MARWHSELKCGDISDPRLELLAYSSPTESGRSGTERLSSRSESMCRYLKPPPASNRVITVRAGHLVKHVSITFKITCAGKNSALGNRFCTELTSPEGWYLMNPRGSEVTMPLRVVIPASFSARSVSRYCSFRRRALPIGPYPNNPQTGNTCRPQDHKAGDKTYIA
jgi:hypothetical protein